MHPARRPSLRKLFPLTLAGLALWLAATTLVAVEVGNEAVIRSSAQSYSAPALRLAESISLEPFARLLPASEGAGDRVAALRAWNEAGKLPTRVAVHRDLPAPLELRRGETPSDRLGAWNEASGWYASADGTTLVMATSIEVPGAHALRARLDQIDLPPGSVIWVYSLLGEARQANLRRLGSRGALWTPIVLGDRIHVEIEIPLGAATPASGARLVKLSEFVVGFAGLSDFAEPEASPEDCLEEGSCTSTGTFPAVNEMSNAVFQYFIDEDGDGFGVTCSGGLLNDLDAGTQRLWALTAAHCFEGSVNLANAADSVAPLYKYRFNQCPGVSASGAFGPEGADIFVYRPLPNSDVVLMEMEDTGLPSGLVLGGWTSAVQGNGTQVHRLSHPVAKNPACPDPTKPCILPQMYSRHMIDTTPTYNCVELAPSLFLSEVTTFGTTVGGSSGSPVVLPGGQAVGQLYGKCGVLGGDDCDYGDFNAIDGSFAASYPHLAPFLNPGAGGGPCSPGPTTACLQGSRFRVEVDWTDFSGVPHEANVSPQSTADTAIFYFLDPDNLEFMVKVLDACSFVNRYWVFAAGATDVGYTITVTDTNNGSTRTYTNPLGNKAPAITDTNAFATCP